MRRELLEHSALSAPSTRFSLANRTRALTDDEAWDYVYDPTAYYGKAVKRMTLDFLEGGDPHGQKLQRQRRQEARRLTPASTPDRQSPAVKVAGPDAGDYDGIGGTDGVRVK